eukprot:4497008-Pyramimonas_sp.AAC.1
MQRASCRRPSRRPQVAARDWRSASALALSGGLAATSSPCTFRKRCRKDCSSSKLRRVVVSAPTKSST